WSSWSGFASSPARRCSTWPAAPARSLSPPPAPAPVSPAWTSPRTPSSAPAP
ncbi:MAG: hypothetical protein AVDCRST_MAG01-01-2840, partial [uncultured Rubrobacteraceae bacterium]